MRRLPLSPLALLAGVALLVVGALGFVPGVTTHLGDIRFAGERSRAELLGTFQVSVLLNLVHLALGALVLGVARQSSARPALRAGGTASLALWALGAVAAGRFVPVNTADNWLHFAVGVALLGASSL
jgi:hypothetical protein